MNLRVNANVLGTACASENIRSAAGRRGTASHVAVPRKMLTALENVAGSNFCGFLCSERWWRFIFLFCRVPLFGIKHVIRSSFAEIAGSSCFHSFCSFLASISSFKPFQFP